MQGYEDVSDIRIYMLFVKFILFTIFLSKYASVLGVVDFRVSLQKNLKPYIHLYIIYPI